MLHSRHHCTPVLIMVWKWSSWKWSSWKLKIEEIFYKRLKMGLVCSKQNWHFWPPATYELYCHNFPNISVTACGRDCIHGWPTKFPKLYKCIQISGTYFEWVKNLLCAESEKVDNLIYSQSINILRFLYWSSFPLVTFWH